MTDDCSLSQMISHEYRFFAHNKQVSHDNYDAESHFMSFFSISRDMHL